MTRFHNAQQTGFRFSEDYGTPRQLSMQVLLVIAGFIMMALLFGFTATAVPGFAA